MPIDIPPIPITIERKIENQIDMLKERMKDLKGMNSEDFKYMAGQVQGLLEARGYLDNYMCVEKKQFERVGDK